MTKQEFDQSVQNEINVMVRRGEDKAKTCHICHELDEETLQCEDCERQFCWEHGQHGCDRQVQDVGAVAYPALCDKCRGPF